MASDRIPVLWLCGPPGVGKTATGWEIFCQLGRAGIEAGYTDIDQLGMCYPEPPADPGRHRLKARNLGAVLAAFQAAGARCAVVSGVVDSTHGVAPGLLPHAALTLCRLRAGRAELTRRLTGRDTDLSALGSVLREADDLDASDVASVCVDTSGLPVTEVARLVRKGCGGWPPLHHGAPGELPRPQALPQPTALPGGRVLFLCGVTGVGKSAAGFEIYLRNLRAGRAAAYIDLDQLGFLHPAPADDPGNHRVKARNLAALWRNYRAAGAQCLVMTGCAGARTAIRAYADALPAAAVTVCRLHAGRAELTRRILLRGRGMSWHQPGDPLLGQPTAVLRQVAAAAADADALERAAAGGLWICTDGRTVAELAGAVIATTGWPGPYRPGAARSAGRQRPP
jgi:hypothetical protein